MNGQLVSSGEVYYNVFGHLGFSYVGLIYLLMLFIPNIIWSKNQPVDLNDIQENKILLLFERVGQIFCTFSVLIFSDFNIQKLSIWSLWLIVSFLLYTNTTCKFTCYSLFVIRYLREGCFLNCFNNYSWYRTYGNTYSTFERNKEIILNYYY